MFCFKVLGPRKKGKKFSRNMVMHNPEISYFHKPSVWIPRHPKNLVISNFDFSKIHFVSISIPRSCTMGTLL